MSAPTVDLASCDTEPIHLIAGIQPHGALIAVDPDTLEIRFASANCQEWLGTDAELLLGKHLHKILSQKDVSDLLSRDLTPLEPELMKPVQMAISANGHPRRLECLPHQNNGLVILEFLKTEAEPTEVWNEDELRQRIISRLVKPDTLGELAQVSADIVQMVTGFDRTMIYRFAADKHGEVIAESTNRADSFLGLHYPASDIPDPARRHFVLNVVRVISDIRATPVPILTPNGQGAGPDAPEPLDLTYSKLRAVAPVHVEYLSNMGVGASMSISLITNDELWGLIACHHYSPRELPSSRIRFAELLGGTISALLQGVENRAQLRRSIRAERIAFDMEKQGRAGSRLVEVVADWKDTLLDLMGANGIILCQGGELTEYGAVPSEKLDFKPMRAALSEGIAVSDHLSSIMEMSDAQWRAAAGAAYCELSDDGEDYLLLVREHFEHSIRWAGKPEKIERREEDGTVRLSPRGSFALWREERVGRSKPFDKTDFEALRIVRRALFALNSLERERAAVRAQREAEAEEDRLRLALLEAARRTSMGELASALAHELNQPLAAVTNYINACRQELRNSGTTLPPGFEDLLLDAVTEATRAAELVRRLRNFIAEGELSPEPMDLAAAIRQGVDLAMLASGSSHPQLDLDLDPAIPWLIGDPIQIGQVIMNLSTNAIAAMRSMNERVLTIRTKRTDEHVRVDVCDTGPGVDPDIRDMLFEPFHSSTTSGMGIGLSLCRSVIEAHGGRIWLEQAGPGTQIAFTLPLSAGQKGDMIL